MGKRVLMQQEGEEPLGQPITVRFPVSVDLVLKRLGKNRRFFIRQAVLEKIQREQKKDDSGNS